MPDYGGTDWTRNIFWDKDRAFVFIDEVKANSNDSYSIHTLWHTLGDPVLGKNTFHMTQQGESFDIQNLDGSQLRYAKDYAVGKNWETYKYAKPIVNSLQQLRNTTLRKGDKLYVLNVMSAQTDGTKPVNAVRVNDSTLIIGNGKEETLMGVGSLRIRNMEADSRVYWLTNQHIALVGAKALTLNGKKIFNAHDPISAEVSASGITIDVDQATKITFHASKTRVRIDGAVVKASANHNGFTVQLAAGKHHITGIAIPAGFNILFPAAAKAESNNKVDLGNGNLVKKAGFALAKADGNRSFDADNNGAYIADNNGVLHALTTDLKSRWTYNVGGDIRAVWTGKLNKNEPARIVAGNAAGRVVVLDQDGKLLWEKEVPLFWKTREVNCFFSADLKGDGNHELIIGSENWHIYAFDGSGKQVWNFMCTRGATAGQGFDLNGDGKEEVLIGTEYYTWSGVDPDNGKGLWSIRGGPGANDVAAADMDGKGKRMVFMAGADGNVYAINPNGKQPWTANVGDNATALQLIDINGDGEKEILVSTESADVMAFETGGKRLWRHEIGEPVLCMVQADMNGDGKPELVIGTEDGHVIALNEKGEAIAHWATNGPVSKLVALSGGQIVANVSNGKLAVISIK